MSDLKALSRRDFMRLTGAAGIGLAFSRAGAQELPPMESRPIPATGEKLPVIGLGTSQEFDEIPPDHGEQLKAVLRTLVDQGGTLVDTAPAYGDSEHILGGFMEELDLTDTLFVSTKVLSQGTEQGLASMEHSQELLGKRPLDLMMVHSLVDAETQLQNLRRWKEAGRVRYIGITTSRESGFEEMEALIRSHDLDFIQVNYSPMETGAAERVIPAAAERGVAVMINRAFGNGSYFQDVRGHTLPAWAAEFGCETWAQFSLKYILGHPDVTCVLTATSNPAHMQDNAQAGRGLLPDAAARRRIVEFLRAV
ncbi:MAG TPA: aldo/keto reductase [Woeseiaceae bacterium]|nr:aldo/keto reductase [Woeseiaceae bacterium]